MKRSWCSLSPDLDFGLCCAAHDRAYSRQTISRARADWNLAACIGRRGLDRGFWSQLLHWSLAFLYFAFVRLFGWWFWRRARPVMAEVNVALPRADAPAEPAPPSTPSPNPTADGGSRCDDL